MSQSIHPDEDTLPPDTIDALIGGRRARRFAVSDMGGGSRQGSRRRRNEDAWGYRSGTAFAVVDGMGGRPAGDKAAAAALDTLLTQLDGDVHDWRSVVSAANRAVIGSAAAARVPASGAVFATLRCVADRVSLLHVGDVRAYRLRGGRAEVLTRDHTIAEAMADVGIRRSEATLGERELGAVTGFLGDSHSWEEFAVRELAVRDRDRIVIATDGLYLHTRPEDWRAIADLPAGEAAAALVEVADAAESADDATVLVVDLTVVGADR